jgi:DNA-binding CsgD family transcriptional regulator
MSHSAALRLSDVRRVFRLVGDCRDVGHDRDAWAILAIDGLRRELGAMFVTTFQEGSDLLLAPEGEWVTWNVGMPSDHEQEEWLALIRTGRFLTYPSVVAYRRLTGAVAARSREQLVDERTWRRCAELNEDRRAFGQDEILLGHFLSTRPAGIRHNFSLNRAVGERRFSARDRAMLRLFLEEIRGLSGTAIAIDPRGPFADLSPRLCQVLDALLEGDAEKQVAARLGISRHTVHDHVKALYRRFDVSSRGELLAAYYRMARSS